MTQITRHRHSISEIHPCQLCQWPGVITPHRSPDPLGPANAPRLDQHRRDMPQLLDNRPRIPQPPQMRVSCIDRKSIAAAFSSRRAKTAIPKEAGALRIGFKHNDSSKCSRTKSGCPAHNLSLSAQRPANCIAWAELQRDRSSRWLDRSLARSIQARRPRRRGLRHRPASSCSAAARSPSSITAKATTNVGTNPSRTPSTGRPPDTTCDRY